MDGLPVIVIWKDESIPFSNCDVIVFCHPDSNKNKAVPADTDINTSKMLATMGEIALESSFIFRKDTFLGF
jgi:hypothetical protein